ncbi:MAG: hypothetical protein ACO388_01435 [Saprospiraceae bacterium]
MLKAFNSNQILNSLLYVLLIPIFFVDDYIRDDEILQKLVTAFAVFLQSFYVNYLIQKHRLYKTPNQLAGLMIVLLLLTIPEAVIFSPFIIANFFTLVSLGMILDTDRLGAAPQKFFNIGLVFGIGVFIYPPNIIMIFSLFAGLNLLRPFSLREILQILSALLMEIYLVGVYHFFTDSMNEFYLLNSVKHFSLIYFSWHFDAFKSIFLGLLLFFVLISYWSYRRKKPMQIQRKISVFYFWTLFSFLPAVIDGPFDYQKWQLMVIPVGTLSGIRLSDIPPKIASGVFWLIFVISITFNYFEMFNFGILK